MLESHILKCYADFEESLHLTIPWISFSSVPQSHPFQVPDHLMKPSTTVHVMWMFNSSQLSQLWSGQPNVTLNIYSHQKYFFLYILQGLPADSMQSSNHIKPSMTHSLTIDKDSYVFLFFSTFLSFLMETLLLAIHQK